MKKQENTIANFTFILISIISIYIIFDKLSDIIIPIVVALLISFAIIGLNNFYKKKFKLNFLISSILSFLTYSFFVFLIWKLIGSNIEQLQLSIDNGEYQEKMSLIFSELKNNIPFKIDFDLNKYISKINFEKISKSIASGIAGMFSNIGLIFFYVIFMILEYKYFGEKILLIFKNKEKKEKTIHTIEQVRNEISHYFYMKAIISFFTAFFSYLVLSFFGLDFAGFWAFLIFILNFVPNIGSILAVFFPILLAFIQFNGFTTNFILFSAFLIGVQIFMGNVIEPKYMGNRLNLSPLVILISLVFWGKLWGVAGMFLSVPIMIILNIIFSKFEKTKSLAILLSEKGELKQDFLEKNKTKKIFTKLKNKFKK